jgi:hypothetical protein
MVLCTHTLGNAVFLQLVLGMTRSTGYHGESPQTKSIFIVSAQFMLAHCNRLLTAINAQHGKQYRVYVPKLLAAARLGWQTQIPETGDEGR